MGSEMCIRDSCEIDKSNVACELYAGINPFCTRHCADKMVNDLFANGLDDEYYKRQRAACSLKTSGTVWSAC